MAITPGHYPSTDEWADDALHLLMKAENNSELSHTNSTGVEIIQGRTHGTLAGNRAKDAGANLVFRKFKPGVHNGPKKEDFVTLARSYYDATLAELEVTLAEQPEELARLKTILDAQIEAFESSIDSKKLEEYLKNPKEMKLEIKRIRGLLKQLNTNFCAVLLAAEDKDFEDHNNLTEKIQKLRLSVQKKIEKEGRPNSVHLYESSVTIGNKEKKDNRISSVTTVGEVTLPSHIRDGANKQMPISNFVRRNYGSVSEDNGGVKKADIEFTGLTHSSYPPVALFGRKERFLANARGVALEDEIEIRRIAIEGVKAVLRELIKEEMAKGKNPPITINLTSLSLVTPFIGKKFERLAPKLRKSAGEVESKQLEEIMLALNMCRGLTSVDDVEIKLDITHTNMPVNLGSNFFKSGKSQYFLTKASVAQKYAAAKGFYEYCKNISQYIKNNKQTLDFDFGNVEKCLTLEVDPKAIQTEQGIREEIEKKYIELYALQAEVQGIYQEGSRDLKKYKAILKEIKGLEKKHKEALDIVIKGSGVFAKQKTEGLKSLFQKNQAAAEAELEAAEKVTRNLPKDDKARRYVDDCRLMFDAQKMYYDSSYRKAENSFEFQTRYLLSNAKMGRKVEWYCKSAEDRTGRLGEKIEETLIFNNLYGRFPSTKGDQNEINKSISLSVHAGSINRQVTDDNDPGAMGLQVESKFGSKHLSLSEIDKPMAKLAKKVQKVNKHASPEVLNQLSIKEELSEEEVLSGSLSNIEREFEQLSAVSGGYDTHTMQFEGRTHTRERSQIHDENAKQVLLSDIKEKFEAIKGVTISEQNNKSFLIGLDSGLEVSVTQRNDAVDYVFNNNKRGKDVEVKDAAIVLEGSVDDELVLSSGSIPDIKNILTAAKDSNKSIVLDDDTKQFLNTEQKRGVVIPEIIKAHLVQAETEVHKKFKE